MFSTAYNNVYDDLVKSQRLVQVNNEICPLPDVKIPDGALDLLSASFPQSFNSEENFQEAYVPLLKNLICSERNVSVAITNIRQQSPCDLTALFPHLQSSALNALRLKLRNSSESEQSIRKFILENSVCKVCDTHSKRSEDQFIKTLNNSLIYPDITLVTSECGENPSSIFYVRAVEELKNLTSSAYDKGETIEQLRSCLLADPSREFVWGRLVNSKGNAIYFKAVNKRCTETVDRQSLANAIVFTEYAAPDLDTRQGKQWFLNFLFASNIDLGRESLSFMTNLSSFKLKKFLGRGASGRVYEAVSPDDKRCAIKVFNRQDEYLAELRHLQQVNDILGTATTRDACAIVPSVLHNDDTHSTLVMTPVGTPIEKFKERINSDGICRLFSLFQVLSSHGVYTDLRRNNIVYVDTGSKASPIWTICVIDWVNWVTDLEPRQVCGTIRYAARAIQVAHTANEKIIYTAAHGLESLVKLVYYLTVMPESAKQPLHQTPSFTSFREMNVPWLSLEGEWPHVLEVARRGEFEACKNAIMLALKGHEPRFDQPLSLLKKK